MSSTSKSTAAIGVVIAVLIVGAIASIAYYQFEVAPSQNVTTTSSSSTSSSVVCNSTNCVDISIVAGAASCPTPMSPCGYSPSTVTLILGVNNTVVWTNDDTAPHTVTPVTGSGWGSVATGLDQGDTYQYTFLAAGTYEYHCLFHPGMEGIVIVKNS